MTNLVSSIERDMHQFDLHRAEHVRHHRIGFTHAEDDITVKKYTLLDKTKHFLFWFLSLAVALVSWRFMVLGLDGAFPNMIHHLKGQRLAFYLHVIAAPVAMVIVPFQLWRQLRTRRATLHRWLGRIYAVMVAIGGGAGLIIAATTNAGTVAAMGFGVLALLWLWTTAQAVVHIRARRIEAHRAWMIRSSALTFAAVTLRLWLPLPLLAGLPFEIVYPVIAWVCWIPNLIIAEYLVRRPQQTIAA